MMKGHTSPDARRRSGTPISNRAAVVNALNTATGSLDVNPASISANGSSAVFNMLSAASPSVTPQRSVGAERPASARPVSTTDCAFMTIAASVFAFNSFPRLASRSLAFLRPTRALPSSVPTGSAAVRSDFASALSSQRTAASSATSANTSNPPLLNAPIGLARRPSCHRRSGSRSSAP
jgi:hypothetical protein